MTAVILQEISQFVVNINTLGRENFVKVENRLVFFSSKKDWELAAGLEPRVLFKGRAVGTQNCLFMYQEQRGGLGSGFGSLLPRRALSLPGQRQSWPGWQGAGRSSLCSRCVVRLPGTSTGQI